MFRTELSRAKMIKTCVYCSQLTHVHIPIAHSPPHFSVFKWDLTIGKGLQWAAPCKSMFVRSPAISCICVRGSISFHRWERVAEGIANCVLLVHSKITEYTTQTEIKNSVLEAQDLHKEGEQQREHLFKLFSKLRSCPATFCFTFTSVFPGDEDHFTA